MSRRIPSTRLFVFAGGLVLVAFGARLGLAFQTTPSVYCAPGRAPTCFAVKIVTQAEVDGGTDVTLTVSNLQGASNYSLPLPSSQPAWSRLHRIELVAPDNGSFHGGEFTTGVRLALTNATAFADTAMKWGVVPMIVEPGIARGYVVGTDIFRGGAEIVGCGLPPDLDYPYLQTCHSGGTPSEVTLHFSTDGSWTAAQVKLGLTFQDPTGEWTCDVSETIVGPNDPFACERLGATTAPPVNAPPVARTSGPYAGIEGSPVNFSASTSSDADAGDVLTYQWNFGDNTTATGASPQHAFKNNGTYQVSVVVTDKAGASSTAVTAAVITNAAPAVTATAPSGLRAGTSAVVSVGFTDANPKDSPFTVKIDWGDSSPVATFVSTVVPTSPFSRPHMFAHAGNYIVTVTVKDRDGGVGTRTLSVQVAP